MLRCIIGMVWCIIIILLYAIVFMKSKEKKRKNVIIYIISNICCIVVIINLAIQMTSEDETSYVKPYAVSPDGQHALYQDGGDRDIFGNSSGYMHYALESDNEYGRVFYCYEENYTPQIEWGEDGFFVSYYCPECPKSSNGGKAVVPESYYSQTYRYESRESGFYVYYELKLKIE